MSRYIDSRHLETQFDEDTLYNGQEVLEVISEEPTADVIPIPKGATNGDMIKAMFPKDYTRIYDRSVSSWWNAPYKAESEDKE